MPRDSRRPSPPAALSFDPEDVRAIADAIDRLAGDERLRDRLRSAGLQRAARYTWRASAEAHVETYRRVAA